jgi:hypothetical protein
MHEYRPYLPDFWWVITIIVAGGVVWYAGGSAPLLVYAFFAILAIPVSRGNQRIIIADGTITFIEGHFGGQRLQLPMARIARMRFSHWRVVLEDGHGMEAQMYIGWYSSNQLDKVINHVHQAQVQVR